MDKSIKPNSGSLTRRQFVSGLAAAGATGPFSVHYEFPLGGADTGKKQITMPREKVLTAMKRDLVTLRSLIEEFN